MLAQIGSFTWPALLPEFLERWALSHSEAGVITSLFYAAYVLAVPVLVTLTDRIDARRVYLAGVGAVALSHLTFALVADGALAAAGARLLAGVGWAGTYMTGLRLLADRVDERLMSRAVAAHAAGIGLAGALSFTFAGTVNARLGWRAAFLAAALCAAAAWLIAFVFATPRPPDPARPGAPAALFDFRPVLRNRSAMAYAVAYAVHTWEMSALRGWAVAFLTFAGAGRDRWLPPTGVATLAMLAGTGASVLGNEAARRIGRPRLVRLAMAGSIACAALVGFLGPGGYGLAGALVLVWALFVWLDSSSLTAGAAGTAEPARRGATLAVHSMLGYAGGSVGPLAVGWVLDATGGMSALGWGLAFAHLAAVTLAGGTCFVRLGPRGLAGDRPAAAARAGGRVPRRTGLE